MFLMPEHFDMEYIGSELTTVTLSLSPFRLSLSCEFSSSVMFTSGSDNCIGVRVEESSPSTADDSSSFSKCLWFADDDDVVSKPAGLNKHTVLGQIICEFFVLIEVQQELRTDLVFSII